jgi:diguanylate cyclase (GGDEF)-like protein/PAS domain S-box-containing protein
MPPRIDPRYPRIAALAGLVLTLALVWVGYAWVLRYLAAGDEADLAARMASDVIVYEDHVTRVLDTVSGRLRAAAALGAEAVERAPEPARGRLESLVADDVVVRSLSLVDPAGVVVASSWPDNAGVRLPAAERAELASPVRRGLRLGGVHPQRDLGDLARQGPPAGAGLWLAALPAEDAPGYLWVATVNPGVIASLWIRTDDLPATGILLLDAQGRSVVQHHMPEGLAGQLAPDVIRAADLATAGRFTASPGERYRVDYRQSPGYPVILALVGDRDRLHADAAQAREGLLVGALGGSALAVLLIALLFAGYRRYEASVTALLNQAVATDAHVMVSESSADGRILRVNAAFCEDSGYTEAELIGQSYRILASGVHPKGFYRVLWDTLRAGGIWKGVLCNRRKSGELYWTNATLVPRIDAWGEVTGYVGLYTDITEAISLTERLETERVRREELAALNRELLTEANTDALTALANRRGFDAIARGLFDRARTLSRPLSVLAMDLDHFKAVNDTHGHACGDQVLAEVARRWRQCLRASDLLARVGGEEFCALLPDAGPVEAARVAEKMLHATADLPVRCTVAAGSLELPVTVSVGVVSARAGELPPIEALLERADQALYEAKRAGRNRAVSLPAPRPPVPADGG